MLFANGDFYVMTLLLYPIHYAYKEMIFSYIDDIIEGGRFVCV